MKATTKLADVKKPKVKFKSDTDFVALYECKNKAKQHVYNQKLACVGKSNLINRSTTISLVSTVITIGNSKFNSESKAFVVKKVNALVKLPKFRAFKTSKYKNKVKIAIDQFRETMA